MGDECRRETAERERETRHFNLWNDRI